MTFELAHCLLQLVPRTSIGSSINTGLICFYCTLLGGLGLLNTNYARVTEAFSDASIAVTLMAHQSIGLKVTPNTDLMLCILWM